MAREQSERRFTGLPVPVSITIDPWETNLTDRRQQALLLDWRTKVPRDAGITCKLPSLDSIDGRIIAALGDSITVLDLLEGGDFRFRSVSKGAVDVINRNLTGVKLSDMPGQVGGILRQAYGLVVAAGVPVYTRHTMRGGKVDGQRWQRLCLPLRADRDANKLAAIMVHTVTDLIQKPTGVGSGRPAQTWKPGDPIWDV